MYPKGRIQHCLGLVEGFIRIALNLLLVLQNSVAPVITDGSKYRVSFLYLYLLL